MPHFVEHEGEVMPSYTGVNQPRYPKHVGDTMPDHISPNADVAKDAVDRVDSSDQKITPSNDWPTAEQRVVGKTAIAELRSQHLDRK